MSRTHGQPGVPPQQETVSVEEFRKMAKGKETITVGEHQRKQAKDTPDYGAMLQAQCVAAGFKTWREFAYAWPRRFRADLRIVHPKRAFAWANLIVEIQGGIYTKQAHGSISGILKDNERLNEATIHGWRVIRVTPEQVENGEALTLIERALRLGLL